MKKLFFLLLVISCTSNISAFSQGGVDQEWDGGTQFHCKG